MSERNKVCKTTECPGLRLRLRAWGLGLANILTVKLICFGQPQDVGASTAAPGVNGSKNENGKQGARAYKRRKCTSTPSISQDWFRSWFQRKGRFWRCSIRSFYSNGCLSLLTISMAFPIYILVQSSWLRVTILIHSTGRSRFEISQDSHCSMGPGEDRSSDRAVRTSFPSINSFRFFCHQSECLSQGWDPDMGYLRFWPNFKF